MRLVNSRIAWAAVLIVMAGAGVNISSRVFDAGGEPPLRLALNIPSSRLDVYENGALTHSYPVSVGARGFETPAGKYRVFRVVWNPWWHPPDSKWARNEKPTPPGPRNPMGRAKLQFANLLYIHGTTQESRLGTPASHGCVRMSNTNLLELARLVHEYTTPGVPEDLLDHLEANPKQTRSFELRKVVPLAVTYNLVEVHKGNLVIHPDVYRTEGKSIKEELVDVLQKQGVDVDAIDPKQLDKLARTRRATRLTVSLDTLATMRVSGDSER
jgi:murein L,D-transpeptidase YcbB/YkuD